MNTVVAAENINDNFFRGLYKEVWRGLIPAGLTEAEADFIENVANLKPDDRVLDLMCGYGRHSINLAKRGYQLTSIDNQPEYIQEINEKAQAENLPIAAEVQNIVTASFSGVYKAAICMGNSFSFFDENQLQQLLSNVSKHMQPGGRFIINTWMIAEIAIRHFKEKTWSYVGDYKYLTDFRYLFNPSRIESDQFIIAPDGQTEVLKAVDYVFTLSELNTIFSRSGFQIDDVYSTPRKRKFSLGDNQAYIIIRKT